MLTAAGAVAPLVPGAAVAGETLVRGAARRAPQRRARRLRNYKEALHVKHNLFYKQKVPYKQHSLFYSLLTNYEKIIHTYCEE